MTPKLNIAVTPWEADMISIALHFTVDKAQRFKNEPDTARQIRDLARRIAKAAIDKPSPAE